MADVAAVVGVRVRDNGLRCFLPPCFSWDVVDDDGAVLVVVSDVDFSGLPNVDRPASVQAAETACLRLSGRIERYRESLPASAEGLRLVVEASHPADAASARP